MPKMYRSRIRDLDSLPLIGNSAKSLGVRIPEDISADATGSVNPGTEGMSVASDWTKLQPWRIPARLRDRHPDGAAGAAGTDPKLFVFSHGDGAFTHGPVSADLVLHVSGTHGSVAPARRMPLADYRSAIAATRGDWTVDEP